MPEKKVARKALSLAEKKRICEIYDQRDKWTHQQIADEYNNLLDDGSSRRITRINVTKTLKDKGKWLGMDQSLMTRKRVRGGKFEALEHGLSLVLQQVQSRGERLSDAILTTHAERLREEFNIKEEDFKISNGWVQNFKKRHNIRMNSQEIEAPESVLPAPPKPTQPTDDWMDNALVVRKIIIDSGCKREDVFLFDEVQIYFNKHNVRAHVGNCPKQGNRLIVGVMTNLIGTENSAMACIQRSSEALQFCDMMNASDYVHVDVQPRSTMNKELFTKYMLHFNEKMAQAQRHVICFVDQSPSHSLNGQSNSTLQANPFPLSHTTVYYLPPKCPTPTNAGLANMFQIQCKVAHLKLSTVMEADGILSSEMVPSSPPISPEQVLLWCVQLWKDFPSPIIKSHWRKVNWVPQEWLEGNQDVNAAIAENTKQQILTEWRDLHVMLYGHEPQSEIPDLSDDEMEDVNELNSIEVPAITNNAIAQSAVAQLSLFLQAQPETFTAEDLNLLQSISNRLVKDESIPFRV
ncbi:hypothetical protein THRCLA_11383 [Thraustotheca clavata]|uniref:HTH CENPB-type domain-containing protein n=1 Tax=Thraustotheca clavata TaxID=74557 RepID=A0A1V9Y7X1_9STRA|nr:hypothetical protein THRCLA_11383 [Thraustotheca clavata]